jgi:hypothetical protein
MLRGRASWVICIVAVMTLGAGRAAGAKAWSVKVDKGFIDDPLAFDASESRFAYVHTDSSQFLNIVVMKTDGFKKETEIKVEDATLVPKRLAFSADGKKLLFIWMDGYKGTHGAIHYDLETGKASKKVGPTTFAELAEVKGEQVLTLTDSKTDAKGNSTFSVAAYRVADLKSVGTGKVTIQADQTMKQPALRVLYWEPGHLSLVGMMKGRYDKKRDIRLPERAVRYGILQRKELWGEEPKDVLKWTQATNMRPSHAGQLRFLQVSDDLKTLLTVDQSNELGSVTTPVKWSLYEPKSLEQAESWDSKALCFSLTVDPVNAAAVRRKKADPERLDLYRLDPGPKATPLGQVLTSKRKFTWVAGTRFFSYLRKLKGFARGGNELEIHRAGT